MTDLNDLFAGNDLTVDCEIKGKGDVETGVVFTVRGVDNDDAQAVYQRERNKALGMRIRLKEAVPDEDIGRLINMQSEPTDEMLAHCVVSWSWPDGATLGKCNLKYSYENVLAVLKQYSWIRLQVLAAVVGITDFT